MNTEYLGVVLMYLVTIALAIPLGKYIAKVFKGENTWLDFMGPLEMLIFKLSGIDIKREMNWKQHLSALLTINCLWLFYAFFCLLFQAHLPLNPDSNPNQTPDLAFNTALSFLTNTNLQDYSGESGATYYTQLFVFTFLHFVSAATGLAAMMVVFRAMKGKITDKLGNFWNYFIKSITRVLLPISFVIAVILAFNGTPTSYKGKDTIIGLQGDTIHVSRGPRCRDDRYQTGRYQWWRLVWCQFRTSAGKPELPNQYRREYQHYTYTHSTGFCTRLLFRQKKTFFSNIWGDDDRVSHCCIPLHPCRSKR